MKEQILKLRAEGKTYNEIRKILGCSKGTIAYHCGKGQIDKYNERHRVYRRSRKETDINFYLNQKLELIVKYKFKKSIKNRLLDKDIEIKFSSDEIKKFVDDIIKNPICYLTGEKINLYDKLSYQFDHKIPISKGGKTTIDNIGLTTRNANFSKSDMLVEEYIDLCKKVLENNGYYCQVMKQEDMPNSLLGADIPNK